MCVCVCVTIRSEKSTLPSLPSEYIDSQPVKARMLTRAALTHRLKKMKSKMVKCKQCDNFIVVSGVECEEVGEKSGAAL